MSWIWTSIFFLGNWWLHNWVSQDHTLSWAIFPVQLLELTCGCVYTGWLCCPVGEDLQSTAAGAEDLTSQCITKGLFVRPHAALVPWAGCHLLWESMSCPPGAWFHLESPVPVLQDHSSTCKNMARGQAGLSGSLVSHTDRPLTWISAEQLCTQSQS